VPGHRPLRIAWLGGGPAESGGAPGVVTELLDGLSELGHRIDCFLPGTARNIPQHLSRHEHLVFISGTNRWRWGRWYSRTRITSFASGLLARGLGSIRLRREMVNRHKSEPYDLIFQNQTIESLGAPASMLRSVPLVVRPDTHQAGELRWLIAERKLALRCQPYYIFVVVAAIMAFRTLVQRVRIRRVSLLICISEVFRDHIVHDYAFPAAKTTVIANPVRLSRFTPSERPPNQPAIVLVPMRISLRKGLEDVVQVARVLAERRADVRFRIIGGPSMWSDYSALLDDLPGENSEYAGRVAPKEMGSELTGSDIVLVASKYEPFGLTAGEALASGALVVATSEVGAVEHVDRQVASVLAPGDIEGMAGAIITTRDRLAQSNGAIRRLARTEAERLFSTPLVCEQIADALQRVVEEHARR
jgi:glycosyltransferase involved in cell wall biosynthesis